MDVTLETVGRIEDTDVLWKALLAAKAAHDADLVRAIENRMRDLSQERRFAHLSDEELERQIAAMKGERWGDDREMIAHSPAGGNGGGGNEDTRFITAMNMSIRENQAAGMNRTLGALRDEQARRRKA